MSLDSITTLIIHYRYLILIPLSIIEGPIVAFSAGTLASLGYFNIVALSLFFFARDIIMDGLYYLVGYYFANTLFAQRILKKLRVTKEHLGTVKDLWEKNPGKTMFIGKLSYGIASSFITVAGMVRMNLTIFFGYVKDLSKKKLQY